jgi:hypothetical protein
MSATHVQLFSSVEASMSYLACFQCVEIKLDSDDRQLYHVTQGPGFFFNKKLILDYYFCLKSGPVFLFQIFSIAPFPLPGDIKLYH